MNIYSLPSIISFTVNFSIAFIVLMEKPKAALNRWFSAFVFSFALWNIAEVIILNSANLLPALLGAQILYRILFIAPALFVIPRPEGIPSTSLLWRPCRGCKGGVPTAGHRRNTHVITSRGEPRFHQLFFYGNHKRDLVDYCRLFDIEPWIP